MQFIPKRPYRCLHCYHRFWKWESPTANSARMRTWGILLLLLILVFVWQLRSSSDEVDIGPFYEADSSVTTPDILSDDPAEPSSVTALEPGGGAISSAQQRVKNSDTRLNNRVEQASDAQLRQARAEVELAKLRNEQKRSRLEQSMQAERAELISLLKVDIGYHVENWRKAWQAGDVEKYLSFYSADFQPRDSQSRSEWESQRRARVSPDKEISLQLKDFAVEFNPEHNRSEVSFDQIYRAGTYREESRKQLVLLKQRQEWKIISETEIN